MSADYCEIQVGGPRAKHRGVALVDHVDTKMVGAYLWRMDRYGYAVRTTPRAEGKRTVLMHRFLLGFGPGDPDVDHINGNTLDNRRENLRVATNAQNGQNRRHRPERPHRGTYWDARRNRWKAHAELAGKQHYLGRFATQEDAAAVAAAFRRKHMPYSSDARTHKEMR